METPLHSPPQGTVRGWKLDMWAETGQEGGNGSDWLSCKRKCLNSCTRSFLVLGKRLCFNDVFDMKGHGASVHSLQ